MAVLPSNRGKMIGSVVAPLVLLQMFTVSDEAVRCMPFYLSKVY